MLTFGPFNILELMKICKIAQVETVLLCHHWNQLLQIVVLPDLYLQLYSTEWRDIQMGGFRIYKDKNMINDSKLQSIQ